jgi:hypothetical protein
LRGRRRKARSSISPSTKGDRSRSPSRGRFLQSTAVPSHHRNLDPA